MPRAPPRKASTTVSPVKRVQQHDRSSAGICTKQGDVRLEDLNLANTSRELPAIPTTSNSFRQRVSNHAGSVGFKQGNGSDGLLWKRMWAGRLDQFLLR